MQLRCICTCARLQASHMQLGRIVNKVMSSDLTKKNRNKKLSPTGPVPVVAPTFGKNSNVVAPTHKNRRVTVLNKLFMKHITDLMSSGEVAPQLLGRGIEITHVKVAPDFRVVNVYWIAQNAVHKNQSTEKLLKSAGGQLQHELSQLRIIGNVPPINFVKNKHYGTVKEVEDRLSQVDFGEDFVPSTYVISNSTIPILKSSISSELKAKIAELNTEDNDEIYEIKVPEMQQNIMGFDHAAVMKKIKYTLIKTKNAEHNRFTNSSETEQGHEVSSEIIESFLSTKEQTKVFDEFLKQRMVEQKRKERAIPLYEAKLKEEYEKMENMDDDDIEDIHIEDEYREDYEDEESYK